MFDHVGFFVARSKNGTDLISRSVAESQALKGVATMLRLPLFFLVLALVSFSFGFTGIAWDWAKASCYICLGLAGASFVAGYFTRRFLRHA
ncbi:hypothetical protein AYO40_02825 [Planctomycetaceae bacterium SCGC AG-212-D15]|nr:hypothetical protein AYO40_02825 [Planctomycetaceae bacterium SCGC AG-212-D15]